MKFQKMFICWQLEKYIFYFFEFDFKKKTIRKKNIQLTKNLSQMFFSFLLC